ncbi:MAG: 5-formyltetrahydrofolate cyclo-ligase [Lachnospiraceae bacterium]
MWEKTAVPKVQGAHDMGFYFIRSMKELRAPGRIRNILEPRSRETGDTCRGKKGFLVLPGAAFDKCGNRIGYGKGYYDTYLKKHPEYRRIGCIRFRL